MAKEYLSIEFNVRERSRRIENFSILSNVSESKYENTQGATVSLHPRTVINNSEWSHDNNTGLRDDFRNHNSFNDQERYNRMTKGHLKRHGTRIKYYTTSYNPDGLYKEDNNRVIERVFDVPISLTFQPEAELYAKLGIQQIDEHETHFHQSLFLELNYQSLRKHGVEPNCPSTEHNPIYSQRGYDMFRYFGYTFDQIGPKNGDKVKIEAFDVLYNVESVNDASPEFQYKWRKYFWKVMLRDAYDGGQEISEDVINDPEQNKFLNDMLGLGRENSDGTENPNAKKSVFDISDTIDELKHDIIFRPPEVAPDVVDVSKDDNWYPGGQDAWGGW